MPRLRSVLFCLLCVPLLASCDLLPVCLTCGDDDSPRPEGPFELALTVTATSETTGVGTFNGSGSIDDSGTVTQTLSFGDFEGTGPLRAPFETSLTLQSLRGTLTIQARGDATFPDSSTVLLNGRFEIREGSGSYEGIQGDGATRGRIDLNAFPPRTTLRLEGESTFE